MQASTGNTTQTRVNLVALVVAVELRAVLACVRCQPNPKLVELASSARHRGAVAWSHLPVPRARVAHPRILSVLRQAGVALPPPIAGLRRQRAADRLHYARLPPAAFSLPP